MTTTAGWVEAAQAARVSMKSKAAGWLACALVAAAPAAFAQQPAPAGNPERGAKLAYTCFGCHGIPDYRNAYPTYHVPKLGGQHENYIVAALTEYKSGARPHPTMVSQAGSLTEQDMRDVAAYFATKEPVKGDGPSGTPPAAAQVCASCHGPDGVGILPDYPTLAGQHRDYLEQALHAYRKGTRKNAIMNGFAATLKDEDIKALAAWFSGQTPALWTPRPPNAPGQTGAGR
jgi:cytochrome c553